MLVHLLESGELTDEEHKSLSVPPGWYEVINQRVYEPTGLTLVAD
jgi:hypothetical protein